MVAAAKVAVCLAVWLSVCQVRGSHISDGMNRTIQNLLQHYRISQKDRFNGKPVFSKEPLSGRIEAKMVIFGGILETYEKLINRMLKQLPTPSPQTAGSVEGLTSAITAAPGTASDAKSASGMSVRSELSFILEKVQELKKNYYQEEDKLLKGLQTIRHIQMDDPVVQSKALWELPKLYLEASSLPESIRQQRRRRRRQARRVKTHQRA
ncbi:interferon gamma-like [Toxotes jaculatrix]|uniref:interferon gamma-like n=1 Tax=Toxotes jaculatrix TaxID=941984 RepID=UPI001B3AF8C1|nr:interferon gamma-like [Toxotes jaculatrix]